MRLNVARHTSFQLRATYFDTDFVRGRTKNRHRRTAAEKKEEGEHEKIELVMVQQKEQEETMRSPLKKINEGPMNWSYFGVPSLQVTRWRGGSAVGFYSAHFSTTVLYDKRIRRNALSLLQRRTGLYLQHQMPGTLRGGCTEPSR